jgi:hypothetical protein
MHPGDGSGPVTFAISQLFFGDTDPCVPAAGMATCTPTPDTAGWRTIGYDLDHQNDTPQTPASMHCKPVSGATLSQISVNGKNGIDNAFGKVILPIILGISSGASTTINSYIGDGSFTIMFQLEKLGSGNSYNPITAQLFGGQSLPMAPQWNGMDKWLVVPGLLADGKTIAGGSKVQFPSSYVANDTWVSGTKGNVTLSFNIAGASLKLTVTNAYITFLMDQQHKTISGGILAGVLNTEELTSGIQMVAGAFDSSLCNGSVLAGILGDISQASDIMVDGTQDPTQTCNGISIGLGFNGGLVANPDTVAPKPAAGTNPCGDGGTSTTDGGGGDAG